MFFDPYYLRPRESAKILVPFTWKEGDIVVLFDPKYLRPRESAEILKVNNDREGVSPFDRTVCHQGIQLNCPINRLMIHVEETLYVIMS